MCPGARHAPPQPGPDVALCSFVSPRVAWLAPNELSCTLSGHAAGGTVSASSSGGGELSYPHGWATRALQRAVDGKLFAKRDKTKRSDSNGALQFRAGMRATLATETRHKQLAYGPGGVYS
eukprot:6401526-Prymnesium_polylepis.1